MNNNIQVLCEQAKSLIEERNFEQATTVCDKILKNDPKSNFALFHKAFSLENLEKLEDALKNYELLIQFHIILKVELYLDLIQMQILCHLDPVEFF